MTPRVASGYRAGLRSSTIAAASADYVTDISYTEYGSAACTLGVAADNTVFLAPAFTVDGIGVLRSSDFGKSWRASVPQGVQNSRHRPYLYFDDVDDRLFLHAGRFDAVPPHPLRTGFTLGVSDDRGETWRTRKVASKARMDAKIFAGPCVSGEGRVTYLSAPTPFAVRVRPLVNVTRQVIWRSYDGGVKWEVAGGFDIDPKNIPGLPSREYVSFGKGVVGPDGTVYIGGRYGRRFAVAVSHDEGLHWDVRMVPGSALARYQNPLHFLLRGSRYLLPESTAVDDDGNVYAVWPDRDGLLHAACSSDGAVSWSRPVVVSAPGVRDARFGAITATGSGRLGIAYYGRERGRAFHGFIAQCRDFRTGRPVFVGGKYNEPDAPLFPHGFFNGFRDVALGRSRNEIVRVQFAPNGDLLTGAAMQMRGRNRQRPWAARSERTEMQAVLGRLGRIGSD
ncbi:sialidase family protein [Rhodococcus sp. 06-235-1A]|uniref:sialidase family protein n=1 Tax=Rhodococcus sp. 06-235-1A TaxID=2022508 RepID=UPI00117B5AA6|nr:sialidase family protein [Rhodococcus sp. 06-235-1A]